MTCVLLRGPASGHPARSCSRRADASSTWAAGRAHLAVALKQAGAEHVAGIELDGTRPQPCARGRLDVVVDGDVPRMALPFRPGEFDYLVFADVLEHLPDPERSLSGLLPLPQDGRPRDRERAQHALLHGASSAGRRPLVLHGRRRARSHPPPRSSPAAVSCACSRGIGWWSSAWSATTDWSRTSRRSGGWARWRPVGTAYRRAKALPGPHGVPVRRGGAPAGRRGARDDRSG